jgi:uncharacterized membrane protein YfcA
MVGMGKWVHYLFLVLAFTIVIVVVSSACPANCTANGGFSIWLVVLVCAAVSSIAGFAFAGISGALLFQMTHDKVYTLQIILAASIALQSYSVWKLRRVIDLRSLLPYFAGGLMTVLPGVHLFLNTPAAIHLIGLGFFLVAYATFMLIRPPLRLQRNSLIGQITMGALGGITGATAAFPGAFVTIWCSAHGWEKEHQRAIYQPFILGMQFAVSAAFAFVQPGQELRIEVVQFALPAILGAYVGLRVFDRLSTAQFNRLVGAFLLLSGVVLCAKGSIH